MTDIRLEPPPSSLPPGSKVWAYLRDSGGPTQTQSVEQQRAIVIEYCQQYGLILLQIFEDAHKSGTTTKNRDDFDYLMSLSSTEKLRPHGLIIWNHARFSRGGAYDAQFYKSTLRNRGIIIHSLTDKIPEGKFAPVIESLIDTANEAKADEASMGAWRGLRYLVKQGAMPGTPPAGIHRVPMRVKTMQGTERPAHRWEPDPKMEHRVIKAFELKAQGKTTAQIHRATRLYTSINSYKTFFDNPIYIGTLKFGDLIIENYCRAIVSLETWNKVQNIQTANANRQHLNNPERHPRRAAATYLLSGVVKCARCQGPLNGLTSSQRNGTSYRRYRCNNSKQKLSCTVKPVPANVLEKIVIKELTRFFEDETNLINLLGIFQRDQAGHHAQADTAIASHRLNLANVRKKLTNTSNAIAELSGSTTLLKQLKALEAEEVELIAKITELEHKKTVPIQVPTPAQARQMCAKIIDDLHNDDPAHIRQTLMGLIEQVLVDRQGRHLVAQVDIAFDKKKDLMYNNPAMATVSILPVPVGAPLYRHSLKIEYLIQNQGNPQPVK